MSTISVQEFQRDPGKLLGRIEAGEAIVVMRGETPLAEIRPIGAVVMQLRPFGLCAGEFQVPSDFNAPLPEEVLKEFEGS